MMRPAILIILNLFYVPLMVQAQPDSAKLHYQLHAVEIRGSWPKSRHIWPLSAAELLRMQGNVFIRQYSPGGLATSTIRGTYNVHTPVYWQGIDISNPMNGQQDLALLPPSVWNITLNAGNILLNTTDVHIGGGIYLNAPNNFTDKISLDLTTGSFGLRQWQTSAQLASNKNQWHAVAYHQSTENNYKYYSPVDHMWLRRSHAAFTQNGLALHHKYTVSANSHITSTVWAQQASRQLPGSITAIPAGESQLDQNLRLNTTWLRSKHGREVGARVSYVQDHINYHNTLLQLNSPAKAQKWLFDGWAVYQLGQHIKANFKSGIAYLTGNTPNYTPPQAHATLPFTAAELEARRLHWQHQLIARFDYWHNTDRKIWAPTLAIKTALQLNDFWTWNLAATHKLRLPTLNELYWQPNGNKNLQPEKSLNFETALSAQYGLLSLKIQLYNNYLERHIAWLPVSGTGLWQPINIGNVWARGAEFDGKYELHQGVWHMAWGTTLGYVRSSLTTGENAGKQLIYIPQFQASAYQQLHYRRFHLLWFSSLTGSVPTTYDQSTFLPGYGLHALELSYDQPWHRQACLISSFVKSDNITNTRYQLMPGFPMPGRSFQLGVRIQFKFNNNI